MKIEVFHGVAAISSLTSAWSRLEVHGGLPTLSLSWHEACAASFPSCKQPELLTVWEEGSLAGAASLVSRRRYTVHRLELMGMAELHEPSGFLYRDEAALERLCEAVVLRGRPAIFERVDSEGPLPGALRRAAGRRGRMFVLQTAGAPFLDLSRGWEEVWGRLSARRRQDFRRARRLLERQGPVSVDITRPKAPEVQALLEKAFAIEAEGWKGRRKSAIAMRPQMAAFFTGYAQRAAEKEQLVVSFLSVGEKSIAMQIAVVYARKYWLLKVGFNEAWSKQSPGTQLITETLRWACDAGLTAYEFLGSEESWLNIWRPSVHPCCSLIYYPYGFRGGSAFIADAVGLVCRRISKSLQIH